MQVHRNLYTIFVQSDKLSYLVMKCIIQSSDQKEHIAYTYTQSYPTPLTTNIHGTMQLGSYATENWD